jgi:hypothetical protein
MAHPKSDSDYYRLDKTDRLLALSGIPIRVLSKFSKSRDFQGFGFASVSHRLGDQVLIISGERQVSYCMELQKDIKVLGAGGSIAVGSSPTDGPGYNFATKLCRDYYAVLDSNRELPHIRWIDLGSPDWEYLREDQANDVVVIHGVTEESDNRRLETARDFLRHNDTATKIVLATTSNILEFTSVKFKMVPDAVFQLVKTASRVV